MRILIIHNIYSTKGGEESVVEMQRALFTSAGHEVFTYFRNYNEMKSWKLGRFGSLFSSLANFQAVREVKERVVNDRIDVVFIHNLFPIISPAILPAIKRLGVVSVMFLHNYRLICPTGLFLKGGEPCERCAKGLRELNCLFGKCEGSVAGSFGYFLRSFSARIFSLYRDNIDIFAATTTFQRDKLREYGFGKCNLKIVPNFTTFPAVSPNFTQHREQSTILYVGRLSYEKGFDTVFECAKLLPKMRFKMAGDYPSDIYEKFEIPANVELLGLLNREELISLYHTATLLIFPTRCYESFPLSILEAGVNMLPVVGSRIGATAAIINDGENGLLFERENSEDMASKIAKIVENSELAAKLSQENYRKCLTIYSKQNYLSTIDNAIKEYKKIDTKKAK